MYYYKFITVILAVILLSACATQRAAIVPGNIPTQGNVPRDEEAYGQTVLQELSNRYPVEYSDSLNEKVRNIVNRLTSAASADNNIWNVFILKGHDVLNAAATRGNYVFVWTGLLDFVRNDAELAAVLGHEIGHVLAGHTNPSPMEEVNKILVGIAGVATNIAIGNRLGNIGGELAETIAEAIFVNPGSQKLELEADHIGLFMMARAGYNPGSSVDLWQRMGSTSSSVASDSFALLSSHPPSKARIDQLTQLMPKALADYDYSKKFPTKTKPKQTFARDRLKKETGNSNDSETFRTTETWIVKTDWTEIYSQPDRSSRLHTRIFYDARVQAVGRNGAWLKVTKPQTGFVFEGDVIRE